MLFPALRPLLFTLDPERAHRLSLAGLRRMPTGKPPRHDPALAVTVGGLSFPSPVGVAPGYDKDAEVPDALLGLGFGFVEVGTITPFPQAGNPQPRLFRLVEDRAVINRMGFNNGGAEAAHERLRKRAGRAGLVGINIGANKDSDDRIADYALLTELTAPLASYLTVNISSPNTPGLRNLQARRVGAGDIDREIAGERGHQPGQQRIVGDAIVAVLVGADIDADDARPAGRRACSISHARPRPRHC